MKKLSCVFFGLAVLLSDVMCWVVGYRYSDMLWGAAYSAPAWTAWLTALPFLAGIALCAALGAYLYRKSR